MKVKRVERQTFTPEQITSLLAHATPNMKAMILLALNCGLGPTDCAKLQWGHLDLEQGRLTFPRPKTGVDRNLVLWSETVEALRAIPQEHDLVFVTRSGHPYVRILASGKPDNAISKEFGRLVKETGVKVEEGCGFYSLRRTAATMAAVSGDVFAVQRILAHLPAMNRS